MAFRYDVREIGDLREGMLLSGTVTNVTAFGAFVDVGVHQDGLVHISHLARRFVKDPNEVARVGFQAVYLTGAAAVIAAFLLLPRRLQGTPPPAAAYDVHDSETILTFPARPQGTGDVAPDLGAVVALQLVLAVGLTTMVIMPSSSMMVSKSMNSMAWCSLTTCRASKTMTPKSAATALLINSKVNAT